MFETIFIAYYAISLSSFVYLMTSDYYEHRIIKKEIGFNEFMCQTSHCC